MDHKREREVLARGDKELFQQLQRLNDEQVALAQAVLQSKKIGTYGLARMIEFAGDDEITGVLSEAVRAVTD